MTDSNLDWGAEEKDFPTHEIDDYEFFVETSDDNGESEVLQGRVKPRLARQIDELLMDCKAVGLPLRTRSDFVRTACVRLLLDMRKDPRLQNRLAEHDIIILQQSMRRSRDIAQAEEARLSVEQMQTGVNTLCGVGDYKVAKEHIVEYLKSIMSLAGSADYQMGLHIRFLFSSRKFQRQLQLIEKNAGTSNVIENGIKAYERMTSATEGASNE